MNKTIKRWVSAQQAPASDVHTPPPTRVSLNVGSRQRFPEITGVEGEGQGWAPG